MRPDEEIINIYLEPKNKHCFTMIKYMYKKLVYPHYSCFGELLFVAQKITHVWSRLYMNRDLSNQWGLTVTSFSLNMWASYKKSLYCKCINTFH